MRNLYKYKESIIIFILFSLIISMNVAGKIETNTFLGALGAIATLYIGLIKYTIEDDKIFKELFESFNKRYDKSFNDLINRLRKDPARQLTNKERNIVIDYFNLCAEEYLWFSKNRIPLKVWNAWKAGILENIKIPQIETIYNSEMQTENGRKSFYGIYEELCHNP